MGRWGQGHAAPEVLAELKAARLALGLTQAEAAAAVGLAKSTIAVYECGHGNICEERVRELIKRLSESGGNHGKVRDGADRGVADAGSTAGRPLPPPAPRPAPSVEASKDGAAPTPARHLSAAAPARPAAEALTPPARPRYTPAPPRLVPRTKLRTCPLPRGAVDENEMCVCGSARKRHDALKFSCQDCRKGSTGCQYFRPAGRFTGAA